METKGRKPGSLVRRASVAAFAAAGIAAVFFAGPVAAQTAGGGATGTSGDVCTGDACGEGIIRLGEGLTFYAIIVCVAGILISASLWAMGSKGQNPGTELAGKRGIIVCCTAAFLLGALPHWIDYLQNEIAPSVQNEVDVSR